MNDDPEMLDMIKALAHADRLKIVGMLVQKPSSLEEVSAGLSLPVREVFNHLGFLQFVGVVERQGDQFCLDGKNLDDLAQRQFSEPRQEFQPPSGMEGKTGRILATCLNPDGSIRTLPNSRTRSADFHIILEYILAAFEFNAIYTEKQVNAVLARFHEDISGLRRALD